MQLLALLCLLESVEFPWAVTTLLLIRVTANEMAHEMVHEMVRETALGMAHAMVCATVRRGLVASWQYPVAHCLALLMEKQKALGSELQSVPLMCEEHLSAPLMVQRKVLEMASPKAARSDPMVLESVPPRVLKYLRKHAVHCWERQMVPPMERKKDEVRDSALDSERD